MCRQHPNFLVRNIEKCMVSSQVPSSSIDSFDPEKQDQIKHCQEQYQPSQG